MIWVPVIPHPLPLIPDIPRGKAAHQTTYENLSSLFLGDPDTNCSGSESDYKSESDEQQPENFNALGDEQEEELLIPSPNLLDLGFEAMLRFTLPSK